MRFSSASSTLPLISAATISLLSSGARAGAVALEYEVVQQNSLASAMMMGLVGDQTVFILDKVEGNFHNSFDNGNTPVWGSFLNLADNTVRATKVETNTFCASGLALGNGTHLVAGGNNAAGIGGATVDTPGSGPYFDYDGRKAIRLLDYQSDPSQLAWNDGPNGNQMQSFRWYPGIEGLADGSIVLIGGYINGGYINRNYPNVDPAYSGQPGASSPTNMQGGSNPTYEHWPAREGDMQVNDFIVKTSGLNSYAHTYLLPSGRMFMQANYSATIWDTQKNSYEDLPDMTDRVVRVYPASGAAAMLPLNKANKYTPTILFCGGTNGLNDQEWGTFAGPSTNTLGITASTDCSSITPENADGSTNQNAAWDSEEQMNQGRTMGQFIHLPNGKMVIVNGANKGTAGYYNTSFNVLSDGTQTEGLAQDPTYKPLLYDPELPKGSRLTDAGFGSSTIARLYHSSALLLPDGAVLVGGSNPHVDVVTNMPTGSTPQAFNTTYELEKWYPSYYFEKRPSVSGVPESIGYGGSSFNVSVDADYMGDNANFKANATRIFVIRPGFSTHAMNMGQRSIELEVSYEVLDSGNTTFIVNPLPTNPNLVVPGPALFFVTVDGVPSYGKHVMIGDLNGKAVPSNPTIGSEAVALPAPVNNSKFTSNSSGSHGGVASDDGWLQRFGVGKLAAIIAGGVVVLLLLLLGICLWRRKSNNNKASDHSPLNDNRTSMLGSSAAFAGWNSGDGNGKYNRVNTPSSSVHNLANTPSYGDSYGMTPRSPYLDSPNLHGQDNQSFQSQEQRQPSRQDYEGDAGDYYQDNTDSYEPQHQHQASYSAGSNQQGRYSQYGDGGAFYAR